LPSSLLERRPDIRQAEAQLIAANAQNWSGESSVFPQINLTASGGYQSSAAYEPIYGSSRVVEFRRLAGAAGSLPEEEFAPM